MNDIPQQLINGKFSLLQANSKDPLAESWKKNQFLASDSEIINWEGNLAFNCGSDNIRVIDIEGEAKGNIYFKKLAAELDKLNTFKVKTANDGIHYYIRNNEEYSQAYWNINFNKVHSGEYRAVNCYVVAPGSAVNGKTYAVVNDVPIQEVSSETIRKILNINPPEQQAQEQVETTTDESRSGKEYREICRLQSKALREKNRVLTFDEINKEMQAFTKWTAAKQQYREITFKKATEFIQSKNNSENPKVVLPGYGKLISVFAAEVAEILKDKNVLFYRVDSKEIVEIGKIKKVDTEEEIYTGFVPVAPSRFITIVEKYFTPVICNKNKKTKKVEFILKSITKELANTVLYSDVLQKTLPQITRIFSIPTPIFYKGELTFPQKGYDPRFGSWLHHDAPEITNPNLNLEEAKTIFKDIFKEFCFQSKQDSHNALSALITPYLRGLYPRFNLRTPVFFYLANRERAGKDYLAGITGIMYEGFTLEESSICNSEKHQNNNTDELRKKILSALRAGRVRLHFSNNKGYIDNAVFEAIITAEKWSDRLLGKSEILTFDNELDFSLSGNVGVGFTPDFANRCRFIRLFLEIEDANARKFTNPDLHGWVKKNRGLILSAMFALVRNWQEKSFPEGSKPFASFPHWSKICGGIMESAGYLPT